MNAIFQPLQPKLMNQHLVRSFLIIVILKSKLTCQNLIKLISTIANYSPAYLQIVHLRMSLLITVISLVRFLLFLIFLIHASSLWNSLRVLG